MASTSPSGFYQLATAERADPVVVGSSKHGPGALGSVSSPSAAPRLPVPVAVAPPDFRLYGHHPFETIGVAYDGVGVGAERWHECTSYQGDWGDVARIITIAMAPEWGS